MMVVVQAGKEDIKMIREGESSTNLPRRREPPPPCTNTDRISLPPPARNTIQKKWLNNEDFCAQVGRSMFQSLTILGLGL